MSVRYLFAVCLSVLLLAACGPRAQPEPEDVPAAPTQSEAAPPVQPGTRAPVQPDAGTTVEPGTVESPLPEPGTSPISPVQRPPLDPMAAAVAQLAAELGVPAEVVGIVSAEAVDWPDASLGCPQPGMGYAQVVTPGFRFLLKVGEDEYEVHTDETGQQAVVCLGE